MLVLPREIARFYLVIESRKYVVALRRECVAELDAILAAEPPATDHGLPRCGRRPLKSVELHDGAVLLGRQYARGGLARHFLPDRYLSARGPFDELVLSERLRALGIPVPEPVAAASFRTCLGHRCEFWSRRIPDAVEVPDALLGGFDKQRLLAAVVDAIVAAQTAGLDHRDLNARNLLVTPDYRVWIVDLAGARLLPALAPGLARRTLLRLARSMVKLGLVPEVVTYRELLEALFRHHRSFPSLDPRRTIHLCERSIRLHRLLW